jgi:probable HAF family extracellular repeat protein
MNSCYYETKFRSLWLIAWWIGSVLSLAACLGGSDDNSLPTPRATFSNLGFLPGYASSQPAALSSDGTVVVGMATTMAGIRQAFRWNAQEGAVGLGFMPGGTSSMATDVSANGTVIVGTGDATNSDQPTSSTGFRWTADVGLQRVDSLPGSYLCYAGGVSGDGATVVGTCLQNNNTAFRWTASSGAVALGRFGGGGDQQSTAIAISLDGAVIVGAGHPVLTGAVIWAADGSPTIVGKLPDGFTGTATAVSRDGSVVVGWSTDGAGHHYHAFRWTQQTGIVDLGDTPPGLLGSVATSVSGNGRIIVGWGPTLTGDTPLIWDVDHGWRLLDAVLATDYQTQITGWKLTRATAISDDALTIAGNGTNPQAQTEAWIIKLPN